MRKEEAQPALHSPAASVIPAVYSRLVFSVARRLLGGRKKQGEARLSLAEYFRVVKQAVMLVRAADRIKDELDVAKESEVFVTSKEELDFAIHQFCAAGAWIGLERFVKQLKQIEDQVFMVMVHERGFDEERAAKMARLMTGELSAFREAVEEIGFRMEDTKTIAENLNASLSFAKKNFEKEELRQISMSWVLRDGKVTSPEVNAATFIQRWWHRKHERADLGEVPRASVSLGRIEDLQRRRRASSGDDGDLSKDTNE